MNQPRGSFVDVDELMRRVSLDDVCRFYGTPLDAVHRVGDEVRTRCFLNCGKSEPTGDRALAIKLGDPRRLAANRRRLPSLGPAGGSREARIRRA